MTACAQEHGRRSPDADWRGSLSFRDHAADALALVMAAALVAGLATATLALTRLLDLKVGEDTTLDEAMAIDLPPLPPPPAITATSEAAPNVSMTDALDRTDPMQELQLQAPPALQPINAPLTPPVPSRPMLNSVPDLPPDTSLPPPPPSVTPKTNSVIEPQPQRAGRTIEPELSKLKPRTRPKASQSKPVEEPKPAAEATSVASTASMGTDATSGAATGTGKSGAVQAKGSKGSAAPSGETRKADENAYGDKVMRRILKTRKQRSPAAGVAVVGFSIAPDGTLAKLRIIRTSGSAALDATALDHLRRSQPFPKPPPGLKRDWAFEFEGRS